MFTLFLILTVVTALLLIIAVLMQSSKGGGLAGTFGGAGGVSTMFGTRRTADFLGKATWWLAGALVVLTLVINLFLLPKEGAGSKSIIQDSKSIPSQGSVPPANPKPTK